jgi:hypothetical protein
LEAARRVKPITPGSSLRSLFLRLWDEEQKKLVGWRTMRARRRALKAAMAGKAKP